MITKQEIYEGLFGAWRLLLRDRGAVALFDDSLSGFWKSFVGAALIFPIYAALLLLGIAEFESSRSLFAVILLHIEFFIIRAVIWPLAMHYIVQALDRDEKYCLYVVAYNWANVVMNVIYFVAIIILLASPLSAVARDAIGLVIFIALMIYQIFVTRVTLDIHLGPAIGLVVCEFMLHKVIVGLQYGVM